MKLPPKRSSAPCLLPKTSMPKIHPTAVVEKGAEIASDAVVGPYCIVGPNVVLHAGVELVSHVIISNQTVIGAGSKVFSYASLGAAGQIYQDKGGIGRLEIGARCEIREHVTMNCGSSRENGLTKIDDDCMFMVNAHVAHDCHVGKNCIFANNTALGGHVKMGDHVFIGGLSAVYQFCEVGEQTIIGGMTGVFGHVIPYGNVFGNRGRLEGLNLIGLERRGFSKSDIKVLNKTYRRLFLGEGTFAARFENIVSEKNDNKYVQRMFEFIKNVNKRRHLVQAQAD